MKEEYPCKLSNTGLCRYGGSEYCHKEKRWISDMKKCPKIKEE